MIFDWTPLHRACENGHYRVVKYLIDQGAEINAKNFQIKNSISYGLHFICLLDMVI